MNIDGLWFALWVGTSLLVMLYAIRAARDWRAPRPVVVRLRYRGGDQAHPATLIGQAARSMRAFDYREWPEWPIR